MRILNGLFYPTADYSRNAKCVNAFSIPRMLDMVYLDCSL